MALPTNSSLQSLVIKLIATAVKDQLNYLVNYEKKFEELERAAGELLVEKGKVVDRVKEEQDRYGRVVYDDVTGWLDEVDNVLSEFENFKKEEDRKHAGCSVNNFPPNLVIRYRCSKTADDIKAKVEGLIQRVKRDDICRWQGPPSMVVAFSNVDYQQFESRTKTLEDIMAQLRDSSTRMIGVHGPTGVGKTTLVIKAALVAWKEEQLFGEVIMANVTKSPDIRKIQGQIADMLGMKLEEESEQARAIRIQERLKKEKENTLIIIDDLRAKVDLNMLGIPTENGVGSRRNVKDGRSPAPGGAAAAYNMMETKQTTGPGAMKTDKPSGAPSKPKTEERYKGCKVVLISEVRQVLNQMDVEKDLIFSVNILKDKEAESLFMKMAGIGNKNYELGKLAAQISRKCNGLPMSIVTTAKALKNQTRSVWEDTHLKLQRQKLTGTPEYSTKLSYELLENEELKIVFLLCARMGHDALVMDLVKYCIGLGFLQGISTVREARDRVQTSIAKLKQSGLLSDSYSSDRFTMQNLVRDAALSIATEDSHVFTLTKGKLDEWPDEDKLERYTAILLRHCDVIEEFPKSLNCPRLRVFQLDNNDPSLIIPDNFFQQMKELRVLILTGINLSPLPSSISCLTKLRMLCLEQCTLDEQLCIIGKLKNLRILSFSGSDIGRLPVELMGLSKLQIFDISDCPKLGVIPPKVISSMTNLEELYMRNTLIDWGVDGGNEKASLSELGHLNQLTTLDIQIPKVANLPKNLFFDKLCSYKIVIGSSNRYSELDFKMPEKYELSSFLAIQQKGSKRESKDGFDIHSQKGIKMLFEKVENLLLEKLHGVQDIFYELSLKGFPYLKHLSIVSNSDIQALISPQDRKHSELAFPKLESLILYKLKNMMQISSCELLKPSFGKLKTIKIRLCGELKSVFLKSTVTLLTALETIQVSECKSLKEIVHVDNAENTELLKFPELRTLVLQSLSEFIGFCPIPPAEGPGILFHDEKVDVSTLEKLELSSIQISCIWKGHCLHFQNLVHLDVNACRNLEYLMPFSMVSNLEKLQSLSVSECENMKHIFPEERGRDAQIKNRIFPKLKTIKLSKMKNLIEIWNFEVPVSAIVKLDTLVIEECDTLVHVFTRHLVGIFQSLSSLKVTNCKSIKSVFDLADSKRNARYESELQDVHLETLPKLEHILNCNEDQEEVLKLDDLQKIWVHDCDSLENIFPVSIAVNLKKLEYLVVWHCYGLREIVAKAKDANNRNDPILFEFSALTTIKFSVLPKLTSFFPGPYKLSFEVLNDLSVELCHKLEPFKETAYVPEREETTDAQSYNILFPEEVINKLKSMQVELRHAKSSKCYRRDKLEELHLSRLEDTDILYSFLHSNPYLKSLWLDKCSFEVLVPDGMPPGTEKLGVVPKLKTLKLTNLTRLKKIGFEIDAILQRIEFLLLKNCPCLETIAPHSKDINIISLTHLTNLEVVDCGGLKYLMPPSTAKSLGQLSTMKVINCESLEEIVSDQQEQNADKIKIIFKQLKALELVSLKNLKSFCGSKNCAFEFPALEKFVVNVCPKMENFSEEVNSTRSLQKIYVGYEKQEKRSCWEGDINATIQYMFKNKKYFEGMEMLSVSDHLVLEEGWHRKEGLQKDWFYSLKTLKLENCKLESSCAIPCYVLRYLKSLKELQVRDCKNVQVIFEMNDTKFSGTFQLMKLILDQLPNVTHVWQGVKQGIRSFQNLEQVTVTDCQKLKALFPASIATDLNMLEELTVGFCDELLEIIEKEEGKEKFLFPCLANLTLCYLPHLTHFYAQRFSVECPKLNIFYVFNCAKLELFQSQQEALPHGEGSSTSTIRHPFFSDIKAISKVKDMAIQWKDTSVLRLLAQSTDQELQDLNELSLYFDDDVNQNSAVPFEILEKAPNLETVVVAYSGSLKEIFPSHNCKIGGGGGGDEEGRVLGHLKSLFLHRLFELHSIDGLEHFSKLQQLYVIQCPRLTTLGESCSNLKELQIGQCHGLQCLFTSSAAKMLKHLEEIYVWDCESMGEIVEKEETDTGIEYIKFERLERIFFRSLSRLECFYSGNATLKFPSLTRLEIWQCPKMKFFSQRVQVESSQGIQVSFDSSDDLVVPDDFKVAVERLLNQTDSLNLGDHSDPELKENWLGSVPVPSDWPFGNLRSLTVKECNFLSNAVLPSHLLPFLSKLEELIVRECKSVETIFDVKDTPANDSNMIAIGMKKLVLNELPSLRHVWNEDPEGRLSFPVLEQVSVEQCESIESLFPGSVATKDNLQTLKVRNCVKLVEIVAKDEAATEEVNKANNIFRRMNKLTLWGLPNLRYICSGMHITDWPMLEDLDVYHCPMLKILATDFQNSPHVNPEGQDRITTDGHCFVSTAKVTPQLVCISLNKEDVINTEQGLLHLDLQKVKTLRLQSFDGESDAFPDVFFSKVPLPKIKELVVKDCAFKEIFPSQRPGIDYTKILSQLEGLVLESMPKLNSLVLEHTSMASLLEILKYLSIEACSCLTNLAPSTVSFIHLTELTVKDCDRLEYLFTSSTAKSFVMLDELSITGCESLETVVAEEGDKPDEDVIFRKLTTMSLTELPKLGSFYTGNSTLNFPRLDSISFTKCKSMKTFSHGDVLPKLLDGEIDGVRWYGDLNTAVQQQFEEGSSPECA